MAIRSYVEHSDILSAEQLYYSVADRSILQGAALRAARGSITGLLGRNGAGKSTLMQCIFGTRKPDEGSIHINGVHTKCCYTIPGLIRYLPQGQWLPPALTVNEVLKQNAVTEDSLLHYFPDMASLLSQQVGNLSGGWERLLSVLVSVLAPCRFVLLDEPFSHLMPMHIQQLMLLLTDMRSQKAIVLTDHQYAPLLEVSDTIFLMSEGKSIYIREPEELQLYGYLSHSTGSTIRIAHE